MATKRKKSTNQNKNIKDNQVSNEIQNLTEIERKKLYAQAYNNPLISSSMVVLSMYKEPCTDATNLVKDMMEQIDSFKEKGVTRVESILLGQVYALQAIFERAAKQIGNPAHLEALQVWGMIALKAQDQTRKTLATLMDIKNPKPTAFIKQQNNAINQQINNNSEIPENSRKKCENELLNEASNATLDNRRAQTTIKPNTQMATLATVNRREN